MKAKKPSKKRKDAAERTVERWYLNEMPPWFGDDSREDHEQRYYGLVTAIRRAIRAAVLADRKARKGKK